MKMTLFELKEKMATLQAAIDADSEYIAEKAADPTADMKLIAEKEAHRDELVKRLELLKKEHDQQEEAQRIAVAVKAGQGGGMTEKDVKLKAKAKFFRDAFAGKIEKSYEGLGAIPAANADLGSGDHFLPTSMSNELITEPLEENSLRKLEPVSNVTGLEEPRLTFTIDDDDLADVTDKQTATEIELSGDTVTYGRFKTKVKATIKDTVLHGTDLDIVTAVENGLRSGLAIKEKMRAFAPASGSGAYDSAHKHMSFYAETEGVTDIKSVEGADLITAIINAWADLADMFSEHAACVMRRQDYYGAIRDLYGANSDLVGKKPEEVIGIPVVFNDRAVVPIVGDFRFSKQNYDIGTTFDTDKDVDKGEYYFVLTAWGDHQIRLKSAFRLAVVAAAEEEQDP